MGMRKPVSLEEKREIVGKIGELAKLLGMIPTDNSVVLNAALFENAMGLSEWLNDARNRFNELAILVGRALDLQLQ